MERIRLHKGRANLRPRWKKGQSGNPSGRPKTDYNLQALCRANTPELIAELHRLAFKSKSDQVRIRAAEVLLDRGYGRAIPWIPDDANAAQPQSGVVRVPYQAQSAEEWQKEADQWGRDRRSVEDPIAAFNASHPDPKGRVN